MQRQARLLEAETVAVGYDERPVISNLSLSVQEGEFIGLVGPNGSGKSTLIRLFSRVLHPLAGEVRVEGEDIRKKGASWLARKIAVVPQDSPVAFDFSVLEMVLMGRSPHLGRFTVEGKEDLGVAWECLRLTNMEGLAHRPATAISGGERQRAVIARALAQQPKILLADEPIAHLDINHQIQVLDLLQRLIRQKALTVITALHDLNLASMYCDRLVMLAGGRAIASGSPNEVITEDSIRHAYGVHARVKAHPATGRPYITLAHRPISAPVEKPSLEAVAQAGKEGRRVHVICGAGTGAGLLSELATEGYEVSVGVVNVTDSDQQTAENLDLERVEEAPFSPISEEAHQQNCALAKAAEIVVVCAVPFGEGNLANLEAAGEALRAGREVLLGNAPPIEERDFSDGKASRLFQELVSLGAIAIPSTAPHPQASLTESTRAEPKDVASD
ncbi:MAG: ATP-binding cassette domain-containing protein [Armatimonadetes bacterium]|nr:ATP-binding cassette domain-containing protein [Armatimonadota bacterium]NIM24633.1 ATP-binding cassette domain-containing protein [Armatimonadota bacterium]NIM68512.1 ATP-binding cassette domain-containing protein [Armatimonadota bacterium]NIM76894.1 ATP-binding cassette domain-containing protein [Armatimonadota bacterium]NIN06706.1 ATP-binding cassette domain-containing protein [Armatimonadota bacterium]